jgi:toxin CcdB
MAQFDVHRNTGPRKSEIPYVVIVQSRRLDSYGRRVVIPLVARSAISATEPTLNPVFTIEGREVVLHPLEIVSIAKRQLGEYVCSLRDADDRIIAAIDVVISRAFG